MTIKERKYMNIDKISVSNPFRGRNIIQKASTAAVVSVASALFAASKDDGVDSSAIIDEYYKNEFALRNKQYNLKLPQRFSPVEKLEILNMGDEIQIFPKAFHRIVNAKNEDNTAKFTAAESIILFQEAGERIEKYPEIFRKIIELKDEENKSRFNVSDCVLLMKHADTFAANQKTLNAVLLNNFDALQTINIMLSCAYILEEYPQFLDEAIKNTELNGQRSIVLEVKKLYLKQKQEEKKTEAEKRELLEAEARKKEEEIAKIEKEKFIKAKAAAQKRAEERAKIEEERRIRAVAAAKKRAEEKAERLAEEKRIKQEKMNAWDKQVGWINADCIFEKVNTAETNKTPIILENGEILPYVIAEKAAKHIKQYPTKARNLINARYNNLQPMFSEKECLNILSEMDTYFYVTSINYMKSIDETGKPFFTPQQCKELLQVGSESRDSYIGSFMHKPRKYTAQEIIELVKNRNVTTNSYWYPYDKFANEKNEQGEYKYTVSEAIELAKNNKRKGWFN